MPPIASITSRTLRLRAKRRPSRYRPVDPHVTPALKKRGRRPKVFGYILSDQDCYALAKWFGIKSNIIVGVTTYLAFILRIPEHMSCHVEDPTTGLCEKFIGIASNIDEEHLGRAKDSKWLKKLNGLLAPIFIGSKRKPLWYRTMPQ